MEIRFISFGSEEAGLRGSRRYVKRHMDELKCLDARLLNFETVVHPEIDILTSDLNGTVKNSPEMVKSVVAAAQRAGVPYKCEVRHPRSRERLRAPSARPASRLRPCFPSRCHNRWWPSITRSGMGRKF